MPKIAKLNIDGYIGQEDGFGAMMGLPEPFSLKALNTFLDNLEADVTDIHVHINSGGGSVDEGFAIHDKLFHSPYNVTTVGEGMVGSIATVVFMAGDVRKMFGNSKFFIHNPYVNAAGSLESKDAQKLADELKAEEERILNFYTEKTGKTAEEIKPFMDAQTSFTSQEAINMGFVTELVKKESQNVKQYKVLAFTNSLINIDMKNTGMNKAEQETWFKKIENLFKAFKNEAQEVVAAVLKAKEGDIHYEGELAEGSKCFTDETMATPAVDGTYTGETQIVEVKDGAVTKITAVEKEEEKPADEAVAAELVALKEELKTLKAEAAAAKVEADKKTAIVNTMALEIKNFKAMVIGKDETPVEGSQEFKATKKAEDRFSSLKNNIVKKYSK